MEVSGQLRGESHVETRIMGGQVACIRKELRRHIACSLSVLRFSKYEGGTCRAVGTDLRASRDGFPILSVDKISVINNFNFGHLTRGKSISDSRRLQACA